MNKEPFKWIILCFLIFFMLILPLAPINFIPSSIALPDFLFCFLYAISIKKPKKNYYPLIIFLSLIADFLWMRPPGLWSFLSLIFIEISKKIFFQKNTKSIFLESFFFFFSLSMMIFLQNVILFFSVSKLPTLQLSVTFLFLTTLSYPVISTILKTFDKKNTIT